MSQESNLYALYNVFYYDGKNTDIIHHQVPIEDLNLKQRDLAKSLDMPGDIIRYQYEEGRRRLMIVRER